MKPNPIKTLASIALIVFVTATTTLFYSAHAAPLGTAFTYQGQLVDNGSPANGNYDLRFTLYDALSAGGTIGVPITNAPTAVSNGLFTVTLDFGGGIFSGNARWLEMGVRTNGSVLAYTLLTPRQELTPTPYALYAPSAGAAATAVTATTANSVAPGSINNTAIAVGAVNSSSIVDGSINTSDLSPTVLSGTFWRLDGNAGTTSGVNFLGTPDNNALDFRVNNVRGLRIEPDLVYNSPNVIGGSAANYVSPGSLGNFIGAGGQPGYATNSILNGNMNVIGGGWNNTISNAYDGTIAGGEYNTVGASRATVPGGSHNTAAGDSSFAAGQHAKANHQGTFVWADNSTSADFASTTNNQFLIRALGGVGIGTTTPASPVDILGGRWDLINSEGDFRIGSPAYRLKIGVATGGGGSGDTRIRAQGGTSRIMLGSDTNDVLTVLGTRVGIGTITPSSSLHVVGDTRITGVTRAGSETGTTDVPDKGIITRRVRSATWAAGSVVARTDKLTLERDGSNGGLRIVNVASPGHITIAFTGLTGFGITVNFVTSLANPAAAGTNTVFTDAQFVVSLRGSFGDSYFANHMTEVSLTRYPTDYLWTGTLTSTFNQ
jgi:hypothetical protein